MVGRIYGSGPGRVAVVQKISRKMKIAFFGDSLTEGSPGASYFEILSQKLPEHDLFNFGKGGDTAFSLLRRIQQLDLPEDLDVSFVWIGVNDVIVKTSWIYPWLRRARRQPWSRGAHKFRDHVRDLLEFVSARTSHVLTVSPLFIGEDIDNEWNRLLEDLSLIIKEQTGSFPNAHFIDLRKILFPLLKNKDVAPFVSTSPLRAVWNIFFRSQENKTDGFPGNRDLHYTIDGVHLNHEGAGMVADIFLKNLQERSKP